MKNIVVFLGITVLLGANTVVFGTNTVVSGQQSAVTFISQCQQLMKIMSESHTFALQEMTDTSKNYDILTD